jgi:hypothetical protein
MDISGIDDIHLLKSIAYDQIISRDQAERNLQMINARIAELMNVNIPRTDSKDVKTTRPSPHSKE